MDIGRLFSQAWGLFVKDVGPLIVGALVAGIIPMVAASVLFMVILGVTFLTSATTVGGEVTGLSVAGWVLLGLGMVLVVVVVVLLSAPLYAGLTAGVIRRVRLGREMGYGDAFTGFSSFGPVVSAVGLICAILLAIVFVPTVLAIAAVLASSALLGVLSALTVLLAVAATFYLYTRWAYVVPFIVDQGADGVASLQESGRLVTRTGWWITFLALFLMTLVIGVVSGVLGVIPVIGVVASLFLTPYMLTYVVAMYFQARGEGGLVDAVLRPSPAGGQETTTVRASSPPRAGSLPVEPSAPSPAWPAPGGSGGTPAPTTDAPAVPEAGSPLPERPASASQPDAAPPPAPPAPPEPPAPPAGGGR